MLADTTPILEEIIDHDDPMERDMSPVEMRAYEVGFLGGLAEGYSTRHILGLTMKADGPLIAVEILGMMAGARCRVLVGADRA